MDAPASSPRSLMSPQMWNGWGIRTLANDEAGVRPDELPLRHGVAARRCAVCCRAEGVRLRCRRVDGGQTGCWQRRRRGRAGSRSCSPVSIGPMSRRRCRSRRRARRRPGRRRLRSCCCGSCWGSSPTTSRVCEVDADSRGDRGRPAAGRRAPGRSPFQRANRRRHRHGPRAPRAPGRAPARHQGDADHPTVGRGRYRCNASATPSPTLAVCQLHARCSNGVVGISDPHRDRGIANIGRSFSASPMARIGRSCR